MQNTYLESESSATEMAIGLKKDWVFDIVSALRNALDGLAAGIGSARILCGGNVSRRCQSSTVGAKRLC